MQILRSSKSVAAYFFLLSSLLAFTQSTPELDRYAATLRVVHPGISVKLANTDLWLPLSPGSEAPLGTGDTVRSDRSGRAFILDPQVETLLLNNSSYELVSLERTTNNTLRLHARMEGSIIQSISSDVAIADYHLEAGTLSITRPAAIFGVWTLKDEADVITVNQGEAQVTAQGETFVVEANSGLRDTLSKEPKAASLDRPLNAARFLGLQDGCPAQIKSAYNLDINVRVGPGLSYTIIGYASLGNPLRIMGISENRRWYRIQAVSGFGWVESSLIETTCDQSRLPVLPNDSIEYNTEVFNVETAELELLEPFYGTPEDNLWFYRGVVVEEG